MKKGGKFIKWCIRIFAGLGAVFLLLMIWACFDDEESTDQAAERNTAAASGKVYAEAASVSVGTDASSATIMIYMNGSDLESEAGAATDDIAEMLSSGAGKNVNVILQTMGTKKWKKYGIASDTAQTYRLENGGLTLLRDHLGQLDSTRKDTLSEFVGFCKKNYPADRYFFVFWDHGGGPVYGFGYDEWQSEEDSLTIAEMAQAFSEHQDVHFDIIGMDCCIMANLETCYALSPYCKYTLLSEDFESEIGWSYTGWMKKLEEEPGISTTLLGKYIVDSIITDNEKSWKGDSACMGLFNESTVQRLFEAWKEYAYYNESAIIGTNYSRKHRARGRAVVLSDYFISDMLAIVESVDSTSEQAKKLISALKASVAYYGHTSDKNELTGLAVSLPYADDEFYRQLKGVYSELGIDTEYIRWLGKFVSASGSYYDYQPFENDWGGWQSYEEEYGGNFSNGGSGAYAYDYGYGYDDYGYGYDNYEYGYVDYGYEDDWIYDYEEDIWYLYEDGILYLYDEEEDIMYYYDEEEDQFYYYDDRSQDWIRVD
ncbi:MAG: hypothetical protein J6Z35_03555, partial [Lachnospiraceae bacterium]|nr:hypothetical protein [Lachnospiraceae bacterium]